MTDIIEILEIWIKCVTEQGGDDEMRITVNPIDLRRKAAKWRAKNSGKDHGQVLIFGGKVYGWKNELRDPQHERPGAIAVASDGAIHVANGGNDYDGAREWKQVCAAV